jgi:hypothetical protein
MTISHVRTLLTRYAMYGTTSSSVPITIPAGSVRSSAFSRLNPKPLMMIGKKLDTGPFVIIIKKAVLNSSQNLTSQIASHN